MRAILRQDGEDRPIDLDLEEEIRAGRIRARDELLYAPWTGPRFRRVEDLAEARPALDAPGARLAARFAAPIPAPVTAGVGALLVLAAAAQAWRFGGIVVPDPRLALGWEPTLLWGGGPSLWTAHLVHGSPAHLLVNLAVLLYAAWRVERALGAAVLLLVLAAAWAGSTAGVLAFSAAPVVGSSGLAFGAWAAQIATGLRLHERLPPGQRAFYGWGNLVFFAPLWLAALDAEGVSQLAHAGGILGGGLAGLVAPSAVVGPRARAAGRSWGLALGAGAILGSGALLPGLDPAWIGAPWREVEVDGVRIGLPERFALRPGRRAGLAAWTASDAARSGIFCGLSRAGGGDRAAAWAGAFGAAAQAGAVEARGPWTWTTWTVGGLRVDEGSLRRGQTELRCGWWAPEGTAAEPFFRAVFAQIEVGEPPALARARARWEESPGSPSRAWDYATELGLSGQAAEADALLAGLDDRPDRWAMDAARARVELWGEHPDLATGVDGDTLARWVERAEPWDGALVEKAVGTLIARADCDRARRVVGRARPRLAAPTRARVEARLGACRVGRGDG